MQSSGRSAQAAQSADAHTNQRSTVGSDFVHVLAGACQRFVGSISLLEPAAFARAVSRLIQDAPVARSSAEQVEAWHALGRTVERGAVEHHWLFHRVFGEMACSIRVGSLPATAAFDRESVRRLLDDWTARYTARFENEHPRPPAVRAALLLQSSIAKSWYVSELGRAVGASVSTLERDFPSDLRARRPAVPSAVACSRRCPRRPGPRSLRG